MFLVFFCVRLRVRVYVWNRVLFGGILYYSVQAQTRIPIGYIIIYIWWPCRSIQVYNTVHTQVINET